MRKKIIAGILCLLMISTVPLTIGQTTEEETEPDVEPTSLIGVSFIAGLISKPQKIGNMVYAKSVVLAYYDRGLIMKDSGVSMGLKNVRFRDGELLYMSEPNDLGLVQVFGICTGFHAAR